jgi:hypothetical protein
MKKSSKKFKNGVLLSAVCAAALTFTSCETLIKATAEGFGHAAGEALFNAVCKDEAEQKTR